MVFDEFFRLTKYVEGEIYFDQNVTGHEVAKSAKLFLRDLPLEQNRQPSGLEITFHSTGYPASYITIVKGEPLGRQVEWDEEGHVLSYIGTSPPVVVVPQPVQPVAISDEAVVIEPRNKSTGNVAIGYTVPKTQIVLTPGTSCVLQPGEIWDGMSVEYPLSDGHPDETRAKSNTTKTVIVLPKDKLTVTYEPCPLPEPTHRWKTVLLVNGAIICALLALYFYLRWRNA